MINIISAIGSIGTFVMALFYFVSVSIQLYQLTISFIPALGFNQILISRNDGRLKVRNIEDHNELENVDYIKLYNLGGGAAKNIEIEIFIGENDVLQRKHVSMLPSKEGYLLPINNDVFKEIDRTLKNNGYESDLHVKITYKHNVSRKQQEIYLNAKIDNFNSFDDKAVYELQFISNE
ncbi:hypothetical protein ACO1GT_05605 [Staphylococcus arlettae]